MFICEVTNRRTARTRASIGIDQSRYPQWQEFPLDWKLPVTDALNERRTVWVDSLPQWPEEYPRLSKVDFEYPVRTFIVAPILRLNNTVACIGLFSKIDILPDEGIDLLLETIAHLISLHIFRQNRERRKQGSKNISSLTDRQVQILAHIANRMTNIEIAEIMGYSESTIRQETIRIFDKLEGSGRNEARTYFNANKARLGIESESSDSLNSTTKELTR
jgi:DNA-binding CsgD family transcriptional regulator